MADLNRKNPGTLAVDVTCKCGNEFPLMIDMGPPPPEPGKHELSCDCRECGRHHNVTIRVGSGPIHQG